jgi:hypothetical protein
MPTNLLQNLSIELGLGARDLTRIILTAPKRYKVYEIPKKRGGTRTIAQPSREVKALQYFVLANLLSELPVHSAAAAYCKGKSILGNAVAHLNGRAILKLDFQDFFPSITVRDWVRYVRSSPRLNIESDELIFYNKILFWGQRTIDPRCLSIGAPTSPILSNILLFDLDTQLVSAAAKLSVRYTRYADDITVSGERVEGLLQFEAAARKIIQRTKSPSLKFNDDKRGVYTMGQRRMVTGLVLTPTHGISIGRGRKRTISVMLHKVLTGQSTPEAMATLKGLLGFCIASEPTFVSAMRRKYGDAVVGQVLRYDIPRKV